jgi:hypothetical protein
MMATTPVVKRPQIRVLALVLFGLLPCCELPSAAALDPDWITVRLPIKPNAVQGFICDVQVINGYSEGYMPLRLTATSTVGKFAGDRSIRVSVVPRGPATPEPRASYSFDFLLPAGNTTASQTVYLPKYFEGGVFRISFSDADGVLDSYQALVATETPPRLQSPEPRITTTDWLTRIAVILPAASMGTNEPWARVPDMRTIEAGSAIDQDFARNYAGRLSDNAANNYLALQSLSTHQRMTADQAHTNWLGYESVDVVLIAFPVLQAMKENDAARFAAIRDWVSCGGVIWTYGVNEGDLGRCFGITSSPPSFTETVAPTEIDRAARRFTPEMRKSPLDIIRNPYNVGVTYGQPGTFVDPLQQFTGIGAGQQNHPAGLQPSVADLEDEIEKIEVEAGVVIGLKSPDPFPGSLLQWFVVRDLSGVNQTFRFRRGTSFVRGTALYWDWLIADVARPPVYTFLALLTGFVLLVGPISYHITRRAGRSYLMFIIAPVLAAITTLLLFGYGFVADGLGTKVRTRQITWSDAATGRASQLTRSTYFAAFRPGEGLRFPIDAAVYPVESVEMAFDGAMAGNQRIDRSIQLTDQQQILRGEFLPSRTQSQFFAYRPLGKFEGVSVVDTDRGLRIRNGCGSPLSQLILRLPDSTYWILRSPIASGELGWAEPLTPELASSELREMYRQAIPETPLGYSPNLRGSNAWYRYSNATGVLNALPMSWSQGNQDFGIYEKQLRTMLFDTAALPPGSYVGMVDPAEDATAVADATVVDSVHYVVGVHLTVVKGASK